MSWSDKIGRTLDWTPVQKSNLLMFIVVPIFLQHSLWCFVVSYSQSPYVNLSITKVAGTFSLIIVLIALLLSGIGYFFRFHQNAQRLIPLIDIQFYSVSLCLAAYLMGLFSFVSGLVLMGAPIIGLILFERRLIYISLITSLTLFTVLTCLTVVGVIPYSPIIDASQLGQPATHLYYASTIFFFSAPQFIIILLLSDSIIRRWQARENEVKQLGLTDSLTGLPNRRAICLQLEKSLQISQRTGIPSAVIILDLDHFKQVNDKFGHLVGDIVLKAVAEAISKCLRMGDQAGRYGGEEFLITIHKATWEEAWLVAKRCRTAILSLNIRHRDYKIPITASFGVCSNEDNISMSSMQMIAKADEAMYQAKSLGRNRILSSCENVSLAFDDSELPV